MTDVIARSLTPHILKITAKVLNDKSHGFAPDQAKEIRIMTSILEGFDGVMSEKSIPATVYSYW